MSSEILVSIVSPTRGAFTNVWLQHLYAVTGNVEFVLVYPPGVEPQPVDDPRIRIVTAPFKGEVIQRLVGLLNASGRYVMALDDDDYVHPDVVSLIEQYFTQYSESWCLRLSQKKINFKDEEIIHGPWHPIPDFKTLEVASRGRSNTNLILQEIPIAPLQMPFDLRFLMGPYLERRGMHGGHIENFNNKVWKTEFVKQTLADLSGTMVLNNALTWIPKWNLDRMLGLFIQAKFFEPGKLMGHWMPGPEQIRYIIIPQTVRKEFRLMLPADVLLVKRFPQFGYLWDLFFEQFWIAVKKLLRSWVTFKPSA